MLIANQSNVTLVETNIEPLLISKTLSFHSFPFRGKVHYSFLLGFRSLVTYE